MENWEYIGKLLLSVLIFAPGLILLTMAVLVGVLMLVEKAGLFGARKSAVEIAPELEIGAASAINPPAGDIVSELKRSVEGVESDEERRGRTAS